VSFIGSDTTPLIAHNARFDRAFLVRALQVHGVTTFRHSVYCTMIAFKNAYPLCPYSLANCAKKFDLQRRFGLAHCAIDDAELLAALYGKLIDAVDLKERNE